ncbi:MAG: HAMP domain-containing histidine kinase [Lachnospiraceae bacterium]|nr:HAMP domain-containing histidine kinase [Lachnospiraceae bacterium]
MKKFNYLMLAVVVMYLCISIGIFQVWISPKNNKHNDLAYKVEIHQVMGELEQICAKGEEEVIRLAENSNEYTYIKNISYLSCEEAEESAKLEAFFKSKNGVNTNVQPLVTNDGTGYVRFDYVIEQENVKLFWFVEIAIFIAFSILFAVLIYVRLQILQPFHTIKEMPYELSKGHLKGELEESKNRFFGRFIWGISMLRDTLSDAKDKELKLLKEKKLLLLSLSHDIKIPLSTIRLYAKAMKEEVYDTPQQLQYAAGQIEVHTREIENFVREIMEASSEDLFHIEVQNTEFYLQDYMEKIRQTYGVKTNVNLTEFMIEKYENRLLKGDFDRAIEVMENLLENAMKYGDGKRIEISFYEEDYCQVIRVFNTGERIADAELVHIFDSFYRGSNVADKAGNGLGLYIARQIMHKMGGEIFAEKNEEGMAFSLVFQM